MLTLRDQLVLVNCRERVYFERQILALLLVHQTHNLLRIKLTHTSRLPGRDKTDLESG